MVLARKFRRFRPASEVGNVSVNNSDPVYQDKWTRMLSRREMYSNRSELQSLPKDSHSSLVQMERRHVVFSIPLPVAFRAQDRKRDLYVEESKEEESECFDEAPIEKGPAPIEKVPTPPMVVKPTPPVVVKPTPPVVVKPAATAVVKPAVRPAPIAAVQPIKPAPTAVVNPIKPEKSVVVKPAKPLVVQKPTAKVVAKPVHQVEEVRQEVVLKRENVEDLRTVPQIATIADLAPKLMKKREKSKRQQTQAPKTLATDIPQIATIAELGPRLMMNKKSNVVKDTPPLSQSTHKNRRSKSDLPEWWKQCVAKDRERQQDRSATRHSAAATASATATATATATASATAAAEGKSKSNKKDLINRRRSLLEKEVSAASLLSGELSPPVNRSSSSSSVVKEAASFASISSAESTSSPINNKPNESPKKTEGSVVKQTISLIKGVIPLPVQAKPENENVTSVPKSVSIPKLGLEIQQQLVSIDEDEPMSFKTQDENDGGDDDEMSSLEEEPLIFKPDQLAEYGGGIQLGTIWPTSFGGLVLSMLVVSMDLTGML